MAAPCRSATLTMTAASQYISDHTAYTASLAEAWTSCDALPRTPPPSPEYDSGLAILRLRPSLRRLRDFLPSLDRCSATTPSACTPSPRTCSSPRPGSSTTLLQQAWPYSPPPYPQLSPTTAMPGSRSQGGWAPSDTSPSRHTSSQSFHLDVEGLDLGGSQSSHFSHSTKASRGSLALNSEAIPTKPRAQRGWMAAPQVGRGGRSQEGGSGAPKSPSVPVEVNPAQAPSVMPLAPVPSAGGKSNAAPRGATAKGAVKVVDSFAAHINENCLDDTKFLSIETSIQFSKRARERAGSRGDIHAVPSGHVLGAFASLGTCSDEEARSQGSTRVASSPTAEEAVLYGSGKYQEGFASDVGDAYMPSRSIAWGTFDSRPEDPSLMLDLLSIEELGMHSVDVGTIDDWEGSMLSAPGRGAQWAVARSMERQRKWVVAPGLALLGGSSSADAARCIIVSDHFSALAQRNDDQNGPSAFSGSANYQLRYLRAGQDIVPQTFQLASPALHRSITTGGSFSSSGTARHFADGPAWRSSLPDVDTTEEAMEAPSVGRHSSSGLPTLARSSATDASSTGPVTPFDLAGRDAPSAFVFGAYSLRDVETGTRMGPSRLPQPPQQERYPSPRGSMYPLVAQAPDSPNLGGAASSRGSRLSGKPRDARASGKTERRLSDWFRKKAVPASASSSAIVDLSPSQSPHVQGGADRFLVPLTRSHSRPYRKSPGPASGLILAPSEREMKRLSTPSAGDLSPVSASSSARGAKHPAPLQSDDSLVAAFLRSPRGQRRRSSSDDQIILATGIQRKEQGRERSTGMTLSRLDIHAASPMGGAPTMGLFGSNSRLEDIAASPTTCTRLDLLGLEKVPPHALTMILPVPMFGSRRHRPSRAVRISFVPFAFAVSQGSPEMGCSGGSRDNMSPGSERSGPTDGTSASASDASNSPPTSSGTWYRRLAGAFRDGTDEDKDVAGIDFAPRPTATQQSPLRVAHRRGSTVEAFRITAQVFSLDGAANLAGQTQQPGHPEPTSFPIVIGMCSADRNLEFVAEGWAALGLEDGPVRLPCYAKARTERVYAPLTGLADLVFAGCAAVMDL